MNSPEDRGGGSHDSVDAIPPGAKESALEWLSRLLVVLGWLVAIGAICAAIALAVHSRPACEPNAFDPRLTYCSGTTHPWTGQAWVVGIGGLVQALLLIVVGLIGSSVERVRIGLAHTHAEIVSRPVVPPRPRP